MPERICGVWTQQSGLVFIENWHSYKKLAKIDHIRRFKADIEVNSVSKSLSIIVSFIPSIDKRRRLAFPELDTVAELINLTAVIPIC